MLQNTGFQSYSSYELFNSTLIFCSNTVQRQFVNSPLAYVWHPGAALTLQRLHSVLLHDLYWCSDEYPVNECIAIATFKFILLVSQNLAINWEINLYLDDE